MIQHNDQSALFNSQLNKFFNSFRLFNKNEFLNLLNNLMIRLFAVFTESRKEPFDDFVMSNLFE